MQTTVAGRIPQLDPGGPPLGRMFSSASGLTPKQYAVGRGVFKPVELKKTLYCEPAEGPNPIMNGPSGGVGSRPKIGRRTGPNSDFPKAGRTLSIHARKSQDGS